MTSSKANLSSIDGSISSSFIDFGEMPIANAFSNKGASVPTFRMIADFFPETKLVQLREQPEASDMFNEHYAFSTGSSQGMVDYFHNLANELSRELHWNKDTTLIEIGCNDGSFLEAAIGKVGHVIGVEPSANVAAIAKQKGIEVDVEFFGTDYSRLDLLNGAVDTIYAANVMCHIPDINSVFATAAKLLSPDGFLVFEDPYLGSMLSLGSFDQIYDEHTYIFSCNAIQALGRNFGLTLTDCKWTPTHGGSMRYTLTKKSMQTDNVKSWLDYEDAFISEAFFEQFKLSIEQSKVILRRFFERMNNEGKVVVGLGATSKSTTILNYFGLNNTHIAKIFDNSSAKIGKYTPITNIPIVNDKEIYSSNFDSLFLFAWNHRAEIEKHYQRPLKDKFTFTHLRADLEKLI